MTAHDAAPEPADQQPTTPEPQPAPPPEVPSAAPVQPDAAGEPSPPAPPVSTPPVRPQETAPQQAPPTAPREEQPREPRNPFAPPSSYRPTASVPLTAAGAGDGPASPPVGAVPGAAQHDTRPYGPPLGALPVARQGLPGYGAPHGASVPVPPPPSYPVRPPGAYPPGQHPQQQGPHGHPAEPGQEGPAAAPAPRKRRRLGAGAVAGIAAIALVAGAVGGVAADRIVDGADRRPVDVSLPVAGTAPDEARPAGSVAAVAASVLPSVVSLQVEGADGVSTGSGFVIREDGYILTNNHVVAGGADGGEVTVLFADGSERPATVVGRTPDYDLAVVKVDESGLKPLVLGDSDGVVVGDPVVAIGAPLGLNGTVTTGIVSALHRPVAAGDSAETAFIDAIQTDAAINPGNSGGPLVNGAGEVVGVNSAIAQPPGTGAATGSIGLGFAIPSNQARRTAEELMESGTATYPVIGVLLDSRYQGEGVQVTTEPQGAQDPVTADGPADVAGIRAGDVILAIDGRPVSLSDELIVAIRAKAPGDTVTLRVRTGDQERDVRVVLDEATSE
ncbi:trypsin-like peptidase domain-containing protein [Oerskovia sp. Sa1BUA8]|uniref:Trypsin-like peptidase domain-containing protein n=1 Tax=Oerskovia douganii TaxID=2762210 RepID=A0A9D5UCE2_9CELL|nr:trypsin-like peptidase domain-containing protein [Oerskovia douganii]MBE7702375.1 trypsin-like peptidase domain-containing protein [Oerskovia douganii]